MVILIFILIGAIAGTLSGLLGIGGGIVVVPSLAYVFTKMGAPGDAIMHMAAGTSLAIMVLTTQAAVRAHHRRGNILWPVYRSLLPGIVVGVISGALLADSLNSAIIKIIFGIFLLTMSMRMFLLVKPKHGRRLPGFIPRFVVSWFIGLKSGLLGLGGGVLTVPFLTHCNVKMRNAVGVSAMCSFTMALIGSISCISTGLDEAGLPPGTVGYINWIAALGVAVPSMLFAPLGVKLSHKVSVKLLKRIFAVLLLVTGIHMLWR